MITKEIFFDLYFWKFTDAFAKVRIDIADGIKFKKNEINALIYLSENYGNVKVSTNNKLNNDINKKLKIIFKNTEWLDVYFD